MESIIPLGARVLVRKDDDKKETKGGIVLPDQVEIPQLTARIIGISPSIESDVDYPISLYDKVLIDPRRAIPVDLGDTKGQQLVIPIEDVVAILSRKQETAEIDDDRR